jgi:hypothetical protein
MPLNTQRNRKHRNRSHKHIRHKSTCKNPKFKPLNCSPAVKGKTPIETTCFTPEILVQIKNAYNRDHPQEAILDKDPREIWQKLHERLTTCAKEDCWLGQIKDSGLREQIRKHIFAPEQPKEWAKNPSEWLSNYDIFNVARQYEETYPEFDFIGPTTIDFDVKAKDLGGRCVEAQLCTLSLSELRQKGKTKIGMVFNLDRHDQGGSHWVSLFVDMKARVIFFFDSAAGGIPKEIQTLIDRILFQGRQIGIKFRVYDNGSFQHQYGNNECGMYSLFFIITMLTGNTEFKKNMSMKKRIELFKRKRIPDKMVWDYRDLYFNP